MVSAHTPSCDTAARGPAYLLSFQMSAASFQPPSTFSHTATYLPVTSCGVGPLVQSIFPCCSDSPSHITKSEQATWLRDPEGLETDGTTGWLRRFAVARGARSR